MNFFKTIISKGDVLKIKPHPNPLLKCLEELKLNKEEVIYIGDTISDIKASKSAGIKIGSVTWGWSFREELEKAKPDWIVKSPEALYDIIYNF